MKLYWRMGWRNIWRNTRRSAITVSALAFSVALLIFFIGMMESYMSQMEDNVIGLSLGHLQIHDPHYLADQNLYQLVPGGSEIAAELRTEGFPAAVRCYGYGLAVGDRGGKSAGMQLKGIHLEHEVLVTDLHRQDNLLAGTFLTGAVRELVPEAEEEDTVEPDFFDPLGDDLDLALEPVVLQVGQTVLGRKLAATLDVAPGDTVSVVTMAADGTMGNELFDVVGVFKNFSEMEDRSLALVSLSDYQRLFRLPEGEVHEIAVRVPDGVLLDDAAQRTQLIVGDAGEVASWRQIQPAMAEMIDLQQSATIIFGLTMYIGAAMLMMNSMLMMVFERIREFGVMKAIGLKGWQLMVLVYFETFWICVLGAFVGIMVGAPLTLWVGHTGIDLRAFAPEGFAVSGTVLDPVLYCELTAASVVVPAISLFVIAFLSVLYPAVKAAVIEPVKALTHV